ncbi:MAG: hypothetical protein ACRDP8_11590 [Actinopolymorphaceae bacterium]
MGYDFFVAGRWRNQEAIHAVLDVLDAAGFSSYCFVRTDYPSVLEQFGSSEDPDALVRATERSELDHPGVRAIFEEDMAAQRSAKRFLVVMPAGLAAHIEAGVAYGMGKSCYAVGPVAKTETLYRIFDRMFPGPEDLSQWLGTPDAAR